MTTMEATSCVKAVVTAASQYCNNKSDTNLTYLQRQLDVLISITGKGSVLSYFNPRQLLPTECLTCLVDILNDPQTKPTLSHKTMLLISNLANDNEIREALHQTFHLTSSLAACLRLHALSPPDQVTLQCVQLLRKITYNCKISCHESYIKELIQYLIKNIQSKENDLTKPCLGLMANLCRHNFSIQTHVKNLDNVKSFYKTLITFLSHQNKTIVIFALATLTSLCLQEEVGERLFNAKAIQQTFLLMFNVLVGGESCTTRRYAVDLFVDILRHTKIQQSLSIFQHLQACIEQVMGLLCSADGDTVSKILELLLSFCSVNGIRCVVCKTLMDSAALRDPTNYKELLKATQITEPFFAVVHWAAQSVESHGMAPLFALDFLRETYEEMLDLGLTATLSPRTDLVLPLVMETLKKPLEGSDVTICRQCQKIVKAIQLLLNDSLRSQVGENIDAKACYQLVEHQFNINRIGISFSHTSQQPDEWSEAGIDVVLYTLDLMLQVKRYVNNIETKAQSFLQDPRLVPFLAFGMTSHCRERVQIALRLISIGAKLEEFPGIVLGDTIAANNANKHNIKEFKEPRLSDGPPSPKRMTFSHHYEDKENNILKSRLGSVKQDSLNKRQTANLDVTVQSLIDKMQTGLELKDMRASEIISVYEHKLQSLQTKENHQQDLLEAKTLALSQADRLISQYRCRRAQSEAEAHKLRSLLQESEQRNEEYKEQLNELSLQRDRMQSELDQLTQDNSRLEVIANEHKELTHSYTEQTQRLENTQRTLATLKQEHETLSEMQEMLRRHNETLKQQHDVASQQLVELEDERKNISRQLKEKESKLTEVTKAKNKGDENLKKVSKERDELEIAIDKFRDNLTKSEQTRKQLQHQVSSLEVVCQQHEEEIKKKDKQLSGQQMEIDKFAQVTSLIHSLSGGKTNEPK